MTPEKMSNIVAALILTALVALVIIGAGAVLGISYQKIAFWVLCMVVFDKGYKYFKNK